MIVAIIDIGSGSIGLALVLLEKGKAPTLKFSTRKDFKMEKTLDSRRLISQTLETLALSISEMQRAGQGVPSGIFCFLSSHLIASQTRVVSLNLKETERIDEFTINNIVSGELEKFKFEHSGQLKSSSEIVIEQKIMSVKLNGYKVSNFKNRLASEVEVSVFFTLASSKILNDIKSLIMDSFHTDQIEFHSFPFAYFSILRDLFKSEQNFIFIDIGSEITDVCLVKDEVFGKTVSFPMGKNGVIRYIINKTGNDEEIVRSMIRNDTNDTASAGADWLNTTKLILEKLSLEEKLPEKIFILADKDVSNIFKNFITSVQLSGVTILNKEPEVRELTSADLNKFCDNKSGSIDDPFLMISTIFVNKLLN